MQPDRPFTRIIEVCRQDNKDVDKDILYTIHCRLDRRAAMLDEPEQQIREPSYRIYDMDSPQTIIERVLMWAGIWLIEPERISNMELRLQEILEA